MTKKNKTLVTRLIEQGDELSLEAAEKIVALRSSRKHWNFQCVEYREKYFDTLRKFIENKKCDTCEKKLLLIDGKPQGKSYTINCDYRTC